MLDKHGRVPLHALGGKCLLLLGEEPRGPGAAGEDEERNCCNGTGEDAFDDEEVLPVVERAVVDVEDAECCRPISDMMEMR